MSEAAQVAQAAPASSAVVVTSENLADFQLKRMGLAEPTPPTEAAQEVAEPVVEETQSEPEAEEKPATEERKQNPKLEKRFSELTKQREAARQEAERERVAREALESKLKELEAKVSPPKQEVSEEPLPEQFNDAFEYARALAEYSTEKALAERDKAEAQRKAAEEQAARFEAWNQKLETAKKEMPDFEAMVASSDVAVSDPVRDAMLESDVGPKILYHLAENPDFARELAKKPIITQLREIGKLEARFEKKDEIPSRETAAKVSKAPPPINPIKAQGSAMDTSLDSDRQFHGTYQQWKAARQAGKIR